MIRLKTAIRFWLLPAAFVLGCTALPGAPAASEPGAKSAGSSEVTAASAVGCFVPDIPPDTPGDNAEVTGQYGSPNPPPILTSGTKIGSLDEPQLSAMAPVELPRAPDGLPLQAILFNDKLDADETDGKLNPQVTMVYSKSEIQPGDTIVNILRGGGGIFQQTVSHGQDAALVKATIGDHATIIKIGKLDAALVESTTWPGNFRSHSLYWSDGHLDFSLIIGGSSDEVVKVGQALYCRA